MGGGGGGIRIKIYLFVWLVIYLYWCTYRFSLFKNGESTNIFCSPSTRAPICAEILKVTWFIRTQKGEFKMSKPFCSFSSLSAIFVVPYEKGLGLGSHINLVPRVYCAFKMAERRRPWHTQLWHPRWLVWRYRHSYISRDWPKLSPLQNGWPVQLYLLFPLQLKRNYRRLNIPRVVSTIHSN